MARNVRAAHKLRLLMSTSGTAGRNTPLIMVKKDWLRLHALPSGQRDLDHRTYACRRWSPLYKGWFPYATCRDWECPRCSAFV